LEKAYCDVPARQHEWNFDPQRFAHGLHPLNGYSSSTCESGRPVAPSVFKTYAAGFARLRRVTLLANSRIFSGRGYAGLQCRSWEWVLSGHWTVRITPEEAQTESMHKISLADAFALFHRCGLPAEPSRCRQDRTGPSRPKSKQPSGVVRRPQVGERGEQIGAPVSTRRRRQEKFETCLQDFLKCLSGIA
jgi:hypothetical protein